MCLLSSWVAHGQREMDEREASAEGIVCANEGVMEEFRERQRREAELDGTHAVQAAELAQQRATVAEMKVRARCDGEKKT